VVIEMGVHKGRVERSRLQRHTDTRGHEPTHRPKLFRLAARESRNLKFCSGSGRPPGRRVRMQVLP
jgi:hypothetical protein